MLWFAEIKRSFLFNETWKVLHQQNLEGLLRRSVVFAVRPKETAEIHTFLTPKTLTRLEVSDWSSMLLLNLHQPILLGFTRALLYSFWRRLGSSMCFYARRCYTLLS